MILNLLLFFLNSNKIKELVLLQFRPLRCKASTVRIGAEVQLRSHGHTGASDVVYRHHSPDVLSTNGAVAVWKGLVAAVAAAHMSTVQQNTVTWPTEANNTGILHVFLVPVIRGLGSHH